jgi:hypothetical protein
MNPTSSHYEEVAQVYTRLVEKDSPKAAASLRKIHFIAGAHATLRAALILSVLKTEVQKNHYLPNLKVYAYLLKEYPEAIWLLEEAIAYCLPTWGISNVTVALDIGNPPQVLT